MVKKQRVFAVFIKVFREDVTQMSFGQTPAITVSNFERIQVPGSGTLIQNNGLETAAHVFMRPVLRKKLEHLVPARRDFAQAHPEYL